MAKSSLAITIDGRDPAPSPYSGESECNPAVLQISRKYSSPVASDPDNELDVVICREDTIGISGTQAIDLQTDVDAYGTAGLLTSVALLAIHNAGAGTVEIRPNASDGWTNLLGVGSAIVLGPGMTAIIVAPDDNDLLVSGTNKAFDIVETGGASTALVTTTVWGRK